jgi:hypothetical protein
LLAGAKARQPAKPTKGKFMLYTIAMVLIILWLLGLVTGHMGGFIHILLVIAIVMVLLRIISGRNPVFRRKTAI